MINEYCAKSYCCEDLSLIENYDLAIADTTQTWDCHHRGEILPCGRYEAKDLKKFGLYYKRPACELIFLTHADHQSLHHKGVPKSEEHKQKMSDAHKGVPRPYLKGVPLSEEHKQAISDALKGVGAKKVMQYTKSGEFVREWSSMKEAEIELGIAKSHICACCKGKLKSAGGYVWRYAV